MSVRTYNPSVRVGNWNEDICLEEDMLKHFLAKREKGELLIQKSLGLATTIFQNVEISSTKDGFVHFGDTVMLKNNGAVDRTKYSHDVDPRDDSCLAVNMDEGQMHDAKQIEGNCGVSATRNLSPTARNAFCICGPDASMVGEPLRYGQHFWLCTLSDQGQLKLRSDTSTLWGSSNKKQRCQAVSFVPEGGWLTTWRILCYDPQLRIETEGLPVPASAKILVNHCKTNQNLCVLPSAARTPFGFEYNIAAMTQLNSHKAEKDVNHWEFVMNG